ncbi:MAG: phosphoribosylaminoimidazolesuccinocarboxamide synthase [Pseudomonadota bacterium]
MSEERGIYHSDIAGLELLARGKVRDIYAVDAEHLLIVATDRLSAFDVILPQPVPGKGEVLTRLSAFWFKRLDSRVRTQAAVLELRDVVSARDAAALQHRATVVRRCKPLPVEAIVRGYIIGSGWKDYQRTGSVSGVRLPAGLAQAARLEEPVFTPSTKAAAGAHDENISFDSMVDLVGRETAQSVRDQAVAIYRDAARYAGARGILIADTKFEFGLDTDGELTLIDEILTPDSSRFWPASEYATGISPPSFDKQFVRDYLETLDWNKQAPAPRLPDDVIARTAAKYREVEDRLTGAPTDG